MTTIIYFDTYPGDITDLGNGCYYENSNISEVTDEESGNIQYRSESTLKKWPIVPTEVFVWKLRVVTELRGIRSNIESLIDELPEIEKIIANEAWKNGVYIKRDSDIVAQIAQTLQLSSQQVDELFIEAFELNP